MPSHIRQSPKSKPLTMLMLVGPRLSPTQLTRAAHHLVSPQPTLSFRTLPSYTLVRLNYDCDYCIKFSEQSCR